jgi:hypothetical protein
MGPAQLKGKNFQKKKVGGEMMSSAGFQAVNQIEKKEEELTSIFLFLSLSGLRVCLNVDLHLTLYGPSSDGTYRLAANQLLHGALEGRALR